MKTIKLAPGERLVTNQLNRKGVLPQNIVDAARDIVANVRANGDAAVRDYCQRFDGVELQSFRLPQEQIDAALEGLDPAFVAALEKAARQIREFHQREVEQSWFTTRPDGTMLGVKVTPLAAAGIYVPGGRAQYPSTVLMNAIPAKVAGVERVVMVTPPQKDGLISPYTLAAAKLGGVDEIYMVGGARPWPRWRTVPRPFRASTKSPARATPLLPLPSRLSRVTWVSTWSPVPPRSACWPMPRPSLWWSRPT